MLHSQNVRLHDFDSVIFSHFSASPFNTIDPLISGDLTPPVTTDLFPLNCFLKATPDVSYQQILASQIHNIGIPACPALSPTFMLAVKTLCPNIKLSNPRNNIFTFRVWRQSSPHSRSSGMCVTLGSEHLAATLFARQ